MKKLIFISKEPDPEHLAAYIEAMANELGAVFEHHDVLDISNTSDKLTGPEQSFFFAWPLCEKSKNLLSELELGYYLLYSKLNEHDSELLKLVEGDKNLLSPIDISRDHRLHLPILRTKSESTGDKAREKFLEVGSDLNLMIEKSLDELQKVKALHEKVVPMKNDTFKGIKIISKFAAGEKAGGEFFDIVKGEQEVLLLLTNTKSYVAASIILSHFEKLRVSNYFGKEKVCSFLTDLSSELLSLDLLDYSDSESLQLLVVKVNLNKMKASGYQFGQNGIVSSENNSFGSNTFPVGKEFFDQAEFSFDLKRGERLVISSPGVRNNCGDLMDNQNYSKFVKEKLALEPRELLNEIFFQLKKGRDGDFLEFDASVIYIEVDKNAIIEI